MPIAHHPRPDNDRETSQLKKHSNWDHVPATQVTLIDESGIGQGTTAAIPLRHRLWVIKRNLPAILGLVAVVTIAAVFISKGTTPLYEATATIEVDRQAPIGVVGREAITSAPTDTEQFLNTQMRLIQSDTVLKPVLQSFKLTKTPGVVGFPNLKVTRPNNTSLLQISYRYPNPKVAADFVNAVVQSYIEQTYNIRYKASTSLTGFMIRQLEELRTKMERSSFALAAFEKELNMVRPEETNGIISSRLLQLNTEYTAAQGDRVRKEAAFQSLHDGQIEAAEVSSQGEPLRRLVARLNEAQEHFTDTERQYGERHPEFRKAQEKVKSLTAELEQAKLQVSRRSESEYKEALNRESLLKQQVADTKAEFDKLNSRTFQYGNLRREAESDRKIYEELTNRIKEAGINSGFQNSSIRLADPAEPTKYPVSPNIPYNVAIAFLLSLGFGIAIALIADSMDSSFHNTDEVESATGTRVIGVLPQVRRWDGGWLNEPQPGLTSLPVRNAKAITQTNSYEDAILTLRNSIVLGGFGGPVRSLLITSASPAEGKTTTAVHLAIAHAQQKRKTLLIDCDLRRPAVRTVLNLPNSVGISYSLTDESNWRHQLSAHPKTGYLDVLLAGTASRDVADLVGAYLPHILHEAGDEYDLIIVDAPPILGFPEPLQLAAAVDGVILVTLAGKTDRKTIASALTTLGRLRTKTMGIVLNEANA